MKAKNILTHQLLLSVFVLGWALFVVGCSHDAKPVEPESDRPVASETAGVPFAAKPDCDQDPTHPSCGGDDGGGEDLTATVKLTGGLVSYVNGDDPGSIQFDIKTDSDRTLHLEGNGALIANNFWRTEDVTPLHPDPLPPDPPPLPNTGSPCWGDTLANFLVTDPFSRGFVSIKISVRDIEPQIDFTPTTLPYPDVDYPTKLVAGALNTSNDHLLMLQIPDDHRLPGPPYAKKNSPNGLTVWWVSDDVVTYANERVRTFVIGATEHRYFPDGPSPDVFHSETLQIRTSLRMECENLDPVTIRVHTPYP